MLAKSAVILIPSYQPEKTLVNLARGLSLEGFNILIVDDGSGEKYSSIFKDAQKYAIVLSYPKNKGKGEALKFGYRYCLANLKEYKYVITVDGDGQHRIDDVVKMYEKISQNNITVIGVRKFDVKVPIKSRVGNLISKFNQALVTNRFMQDNQCGLRAFPYKILTDMVNIFGSRYEYEMNVLTYLLTKEIPFQCMRVQTIYENNNSGSHFRPIQDTLRINSSILLYGLISLFLYIGQALATFLMFNYVDFSLPINLELTATISFIGSLILTIILKLAIYRPKYPGKLILRIIIYELLKFIATLVSVSLFVRVLSQNIFLTYFIAYVLTLLPRYYLVKGMGLVYDTNLNND